MLLISESRVRTNLQRMADRARRHGIALRPHAKTHQSLVVSQWMKEYGITEIAVTGVRMAARLLPGDWERMTIAMPVNTGESHFKELDRLAEHSRLTVFITSLATAHALREFAPDRVDAYVELDAGYGRSGVDFREEALLAELISVIGPDRFRGFYVHSGHTYGAASLVEIGGIHQELLSAFARVRAYPATPAGCEYVTGDTPACSSQEDFTGVTAIGPGNFVYYDLVQTGLGACTAEQIAICYAAPVLEVHANRKEVIVHAGWVQLGKDQLPDGTFGRLVRLQNDKWESPVPDASMIRLSQEHGTATLPADWLAELRPGDLVGILPVHACAAVHGALATGEQRIVP